MGGGLGVRELVHVGLLSSAFWVAFVPLLRGGRSSNDGSRAIVALLLGAGFAHAGWATLHLQVVRHAAWVILDPSRGFCVLFVPLGFLAAAPWRHGVGPALAFLGLAFTTLPLALATARLGCLVAGCCHGPATSLPWGVRAAGSTAAVHPTPAYEMLGLVCLSALIARAPERMRAGVFCAGFGALRIVLEPWRTEVSLGAPLVTPALLAMLWVLTGAALCAASVRRA